jgi:hypothetical protein
MQNNQRSIVKPIVFGFAVLSVGQVFIAAVMISGNIPNLGSELRVKAVAVVSAITLSGAFLAWYVTCWTKKLASHQPALGITGALAANLIRLIVPLLALAYFQTSAAEVHWSGALQIFVRETLVASYLVLLLLDILLHVAGYGGGVQAVKHHAPE